MRRMRATRGHRRILTLLALALAVIAGFLPAAAQSGSEAVVCVGSERRTLATNPIRRVYTEDMEVVYRIGADIGQRDQVERDLRSELGSYPEVWCAWSGSGDDHAVIISYTGVIRQDLTVDPEDPRFQAFGVGFGTDFDAAETQATTTSQRFTNYNDGSGFEVLLRENWGVGERVAAGGSARRFSQPDGLVCTGNYSPDSCWMELADRPGCYLWNPAPKDNETVGWSGGCSNGLAQGSGRISWFQNDELSRTEDTRLQDGHRDGLHATRGADGTREAQGTYVSGERHGTWTFFHEGHDANLVRSVGPYMDGERHGTWTESYESRDDRLVRAVGLWVNGKRQGAWVFHYADGHQGGGPYLNGERHGTWTVFLPEGRDDNVVRDVGPYVNGERHGTWTGYDASWRVVGTIRYENGRRVSGFTSLVGWHQSPWGEGIT